MHVIFTIVSANYTAHARTLMQSIARFTPDVRRIVVFTDGVASHEDERLAAEAWDASAFAPLDAMAFYYSVLELNTAVKPHAFRAIFADPAVETVTYLDPDIMALRSIDVIHEALHKAPLVLTPHLTEPLSPGAQPDDRAILLSGAYNLGFLGLARSNDTSRFIDWWAERCRFDCRVAFAEGLFTDQRWVDLAPGFFEDHVLIRDPGVNLGYWNLPSRAVAQTDEGWTAAGKPLVFFHFSGFDPTRPDILSKHQDRVRVQPKSALDKLLRLYAKQLLANGYASASKAPYGHDRFADGQPISNVMRRRMLDDARSERWSAGDGSDPIRWLTSVDPDLIRAGLPPVTRLAAQGGRDLGAKIAGADLETAAGREVLATWARGQLRPPAPIDERPETTGSIAASSREVRAWVSSVDGLDQATAMFLASHPQWRGVNGAIDAQRDGRAWCLGPAAVNGWFPTADLDPSLLKQVIEKDPGLALRAAEMVLAQRRLAVTPRSRRLYAAFGLAVDARWPKDLREQLARRFGMADEQAASPDAALSIWRDRVDLQREFDLSILRDRLRFSRWLITVGRQELGLPLAGLSSGKCLGAPFAAALALASVRDPVGTRLPDCDRLIIAHGSERLSGLKGREGDCRVVVEDASGAAPSPSLPRKAKVLVHVGSPANLAATVLLCAANDVVYGARLDPV